MAQDPCYTVGAVTVIEFSISKVRGGDSKDLTRYTVNLELTEDITTPYVQGAAFFSDTDGFFSSEKIVGGEFLFLAYHSPYSEDKMFGSFVVTAIKNRVFDGSSKSLIVIEFVSENAYFNLHKKVPKLYKGNPVKMIKNILVDDLKVEYDPILYVNDIAVNEDADVPPFPDVSYMASVNDSPMEVIKSIAALMVDDSQQTNVGGVAGYFFFEGMKSGFELRSYRDMMGKDRKDYLDLNEKTIEEASVIENDPSIADRVFFYDNNPGRDGGMKSFQKMQQQIQHMVVLSQFDMVPRLMMGALGKNVIEFDVTSKSVVPTATYKYSDSFDSMQTLNLFDMNTPPSETIGKVSTHNSFNKSYSNTYLDTSVQKTKTDQVVGMLTTNAIEIEIHGRTTLDIGSRVWVFVSNQVGSAGDVGVSNIDTLLTGWYLVTNMKHGLNLKGNYHQMNLRLVSDSYNEG